ncbi:hypothetical protein CDAR_487231 [Caerostris darwini]|uniref:Uncharacterized protein n=1 Tax=Caerostris darwini TaxID=1538125 RepID=A0AAV4UEX8_9ARAC|nr:hypothetical protein CDAR_487231 [Caerostris darwini]
MNLLFLFPQEIYLDHNNLTDLDSVLHPQMYNLDRLYVSHNTFARVTENSFNGKANSTRYILLDHCFIREFSVRQYIGLPLLVTLDLSYNLIDQVTYQLGHNQKKNFTDDHVRKYTNGRIKRLSMVGNRIPFLRSGVFIELTGLQSLQLQDNRIGHVERNIFRFLRSVLEVLDLSGNEIRSLGGCVRFLSVLTTLNLANNRIEVMMF